MRHQTILNSTSFECRCIQTKASTVLYQYHTYAYQFYICCCFHLDDAAGAWRIYWHKIDDWHVTSQFKMLVVSIKSASDSILCLLVDSKSIFTSSSLWKMDTIPQRTTRIQALCFNWWLFEILSNTNRLPDLLICSEKGYVKRVCSHRPSLLLARSISLHVFFFSM